MKTAQQAKPSPATSASPKTPRTPLTSRKTARTTARTTARRTKTSTNADYLLYALCALTAGALALNALAALYFISYTRQLSAPLALELPTPGSGLSPSSGWLPPSADGVAAAEFMVSTAAPDLDTIDQPAETVDPTTTSAQPETKSPR